MMTQEEFDNFRYSYIPIDGYKDDKIRISGCIMFNEIYTFLINVIDGDLRHYKNLSMTSPEIICEYEDDYKLTKEDVDELMYILEKNNGWNLIIESMKMCKETEHIEDSYLKIDFNKIPISPPNYRELVTD